MCLSLSFAIFYWDIYKELLQIRKTIVKISILSYAVNIFIQLFIFDVIDDLKIVSWGLSKLLVFSAMILGFGIVLGKDYCTSKL